MPYIINRNEMVFYFIEMVWLFIGVYIIIEHFICMAV